jgi:hypothetical protein
VEAVLLPAPPPAVRTDLNFILDDDDDDVDPMSVSLVALAMLCDASTAYVLDPVLVFLRSGL